MKIRLEKNTPWKKKIPLFAKEVSECGKKIQPEKKYRYSARGVSEWVEYHYQGKNNTPLGSLYQNLNFWSESILAVWGTEAKCLMPAKCADVGVNEH